MERNPEDIPAHLDDIVESLPDAFMELDSDWRILAMNSAAERVSGRSRAAMIGKTIWAVFPELIGGPFEEPFRRAMRDRVPTRTERLAEARGRWFEIEVRPLASGGVAKYTRDTTDRHRAEDAARVIAHERDELLARLQEQFDRMPLACVVSDPSMRIIDWNPAAARVFGYSREEVLGRDGYALLVPPDARAQIGDVVWRASDGGVQGHLINENLTKSGRVILCAWHNTPLRDREGRVIAVLAMAEDVTEREALLERERVARTEAERVARLKDDFLATLSHELRTPLSAILSWADLLQAVPGDAPRVEHGLEIIARNARTQAQLVGDLLDLSRIVSGKLRLDVERVSVPAIVEATVEAMRPMADLRGVRLQLLVEPITQPVHGDASRLQQVVWNLLSNAIKFTPQGGRVQVVVSRVNSQLEISVSDNGQGIDASFLPYVFARFRQADASAAREHGGLGIGLALVKELVELHGGTVTAHSEGRGLGATFVVKLPIAILTTASGEVRTHPRVPAALSLIDISTPRLTGVRVLVVDDEPDGLEVIRQVLADQRAEVTAVRSVDDALGMLDTQSFDVLLSDIGMARRDGYELIAEVRRRGITLPAAAVTAFARSEDRTRALLAGFQAHIAKPLEVAELVATVASLSGRVTL